MSQDYEEYHIDFDRIKPIESEKNPTNGGSQGCCQPSTTLLACVVIAGCIGILAGLAVPLAVILTVTTTPVANTTLLTTTSSPSTTTMSTTAAPVYHSLGNLTENSLVNLTCASPTPTINIIYAFYGVQNMSQCNCNVSACTITNVTKTLNTYCASSGYPSLCTFTAAMPTIGAPYSLRVMSYNIRYETSSDGINRWSVRKHNVFNLIRNRAPDVFGLQEALRGQISDLKYVMPNYNYYGVGDRDGKTSGEFAPIFYRSDRFDLIDNGTFWLSKTPTTSGSKGWDAAAPRICSWVKLRDRRTFQTFYHFNTHFDSQGRTSRVEGARLILSLTKTIAGYSTPIILTGDFNASPTSDAYRTMITNTHFIDSKHLSETSHCGPDSTFSTFFVGQPMGKSIDHIFVTSKDFKILQHGTLIDSNNGFYPSDHLPVLAELTLKNTTFG